MSDSRFAAEKIEATKARIRRDRDALRSLGIDIVGISRLHGSTKVHVMVSNNPEIAEEIMREFYGDIVHVTEGRPSPT